MAAPRQSFSRTVKAELSHIWPRRLCCRQAELSGLLTTGGALELAGQGQVGIRFSTDHGGVARLALRLVREEWALTAQVTVKRRRRLRKALTYEIRVPPQPLLKELMHRAGLLGGTHGLGTDLPEGLTERTCCAKAYLRGAFLGSGWVSDPERGHHLEIVTRVAEHADGLSQLCFQFRVPARITSRKDSFIVYMKDAAHIAEFLGLAGAQEQRFRYEDVRILKDVKNRVNRQVNAETANLGKTVAAAARQVLAIRALQVSGRLSRLPPALQEMAALRLRHPEASLKELGELCQPPVGKSGANHRMRMLTQFSDGEGPEEPGRP